MKKVCDRCGDNIIPPVMKIDYLYTRLYFDEGCILLMEKKGLIYKSKVVNEITKPLTKKKHD